MVGARSVNVKNTCSGDGNGDEDGNGVGNESGIREGAREAKKRKKPHRSCRSHVGNGGDLVDVGGKRKTRRQERVGPVAAIAFQII